jgi:hypothetical protein
MKPKFALLFITAVLVFSTGNVFAQLSGALDYDKAAPKPSKGGKFCPDKAPMTASNLLLGFNLVAVK